MTVISNCPHFCVTVPNDQSHLRTANGAKVEFVTENGERIDVSPVIQSVSIDMSVGRVVTATLTAVAVEILSDWKPSGIDS